MDDATNVIRFPKSNIRQLELEFDDDAIKEEADVAKRVEAVQNLHIDRILDEITNNLVENLIVGGFEIDGQEPDFAFIVEGIRALMSRKYKIFHPFQKFAETSMFLDDDDIFTIHPGVDVVLNNESDDSEENSEAIDSGETTTEESVSG